jgi:3,4-dihydroxy-9,10-secoandrosta-1,3,5(10)-triene-9,17-dione 4,5-dioxygenase
MTIRSLGYLAWSTPDIDAWTTFARRVLGLMQVDGPDADARYFRIDDRPYRLVLTHADEPGPSAIGYEVVDDLKLAAVVDRVKDAGIQVRTLSDEEVQQRLVTGAVRFRDPGGLPIELFHGPVLDHVSLDTPNNIQFVTGELGLGHVVVGVAHLQEFSAFYRTVLGFRLRNTMRMERDGRTRTTHFLGCNARHHTLGVVDLEVPGQVLHIMLQVSTLDEVGAALDRCREFDVPIAMSLGRHTNDRMVSFYCGSPDGLRVEYGWGGPLVDDDTETTYEITKSSFWGHHPPPAQ